MRLALKKSGSDMALYILDSERINGKVVTKTIMKCGKLSELSKIYDDPIMHFKELTKQMTLEKKEKKSESISIAFSPNQDIPLRKKSIYNIGYLYLKKIYCELGIGTICQELKTYYKLDFNLDAVLENLIFTRVLFSTPKTPAFELSDQFLEYPKYTASELTKTIDFLAEHADLIQTKLYTYSTNVYARDTKTIYIDKMTFNFEDNKADEEKPSSRNHDTKITINLYSDVKGIPIYYNTLSGIPLNKDSILALEKKCDMDYAKAEKIYYYGTETSINETNHIIASDNKAYIVAQTMKKIRFYLKDWAVDSKGWTKNSNHSKNNFDLTLAPSDSNEIYFKVREIKEKIKVDKEEKYIQHKCIVVFSAIYKLQQQKIREQQIELAKKIILTPQNYTRNSIGEGAKYIKNLCYSSDGLIINSNSLILNLELIQDEIKFEGFQCLISNLKDIANVIRINHNRFRTSEFLKSGRNNMQENEITLPYDVRVKAHNLINYLSFIVNRILEYKIGKKCLLNDTLNTLRKFNVFRLKNEGYAPIYERTDITDILYEIFNFNFYSELITHQEMKNILSQLIKS